MRALEPRETGLTAGRIWRPLRADEIAAGKRLSANPFGAHAPSLAQRMLIGLARRTFLRRGEFRERLGRLIIAMTDGPLDVYFRGCAYRLWGENNLIEWGIMLNPQYNGRDLDFLIEGAGHDSNFVDIGSNIGLYAQPLAKAAPSGKTVAIDANPLMIERLRFNAASSGLSNIRIVPSAVGDAPGKAALKIRKDDIAIVAIEEAADGPIPIQTVSAILDAQKIETVHGLKIDIEGHEDRALVPFLNAAEPSRLPRRIVIEHPFPDADYPGCAEVFAARGYRLKGRSRNNSFYGLD